MGSIACNQCPKSFRNESGLAWHVAHIHRGGSENGSISQVKALETIDSQTALSAIPGNFEDTVGAVSGLVEEVSEIQDLLEFARGSIETMSARQTSLENGVQQLDSKVISLSQLLEGLEAVRTQVKSQERDLAHLNEVVSAVCRLLWELDVAHKDQQNICDIVVNVSPEARESAREVLRERLSIYRS